MNKLEKVLAEYHDDWQLATGDDNDTLRQVQRLTAGKIKTAHQHQIVRWVREFLRFAKDPSTSSLRLRSLRLRSLRLRSGSTTGSTTGQAGTMPGCKRKEHQYPLTQKGQSRIAKDFQKFCWSKLKIFRARGFVVTLRNHNCYAIDIYV